jgi:hypothetical protein
MFKILFHICGIAIIEVLFYFFYIGPMESNIFKDAFSASLNNMDDLYNKNSIHIISPYNNTEIIILKNNAESNVTNYLNNLNDEGKNYDASSYHRDIKPFLFTSVDKYPNVYTLIIFLDDTEHIQGGETLNVKKGDCLLFNSFNLHKSKKLGLNDKNRTPRRVLQYFHVFFNENEATEFEKHHSYAEHLDFGILTKYVNYFIDLRPELEYFNLFSYIAGRNYTHNAKYITFISKEHIIGKADDVKYYTNF